MNKTFLAFLLVVPLGLQAKTLDFKKDFAKMLVGHWTTKDGYQKGSRGYGKRSHLYYDGTLFIDSDFETPQKYDVSVLDEKKRMVKVTSYNSSGKVALDEALVFSADGKKVTHYFIDWTNNKVDYTDAQKWTYADGKTHP